MHPTRFLHGLRPGLFSALFLLCLSLRLEAKPEPARSVFGSYAPAAWNWHAGSNSGGFLNSGPPVSLRHDLAFALGLSAEAEARVNAAIAKAERELHDGEIRRALVRKKGTAEEEIYLLPDAVLHRTMTSQIQQALTKEIQRSDTADIAAILTGQRPFLMALASVSITTGSPVQRFQWSAPGGGEIVRVTRREDQPDLMDYWQRVLDAKDSLASGDTGKDAVIAAGSSRAFSVKIPADLWWALRQGYSWRGSSALAPLKTVLARFESLAADHLDCEPMAVQARKVILPLDAAVSQSQMDAVRATDPGEPVRIDCTGVWKAVAECKATLLKEVSSDSDRVFMGNLFAGMIEYPHLTLRKAPAEWAPSGMSVEIVTPEGKLLGRIFGDEGGEFVAALCRQQEIPLLPKKEVSEGPDPFSGDDTADTSSQSDRPRDPFAPGKQ